MAIDNPATVATPPIAGSVIMLLWNLTDPGFYDENGFAWLALNGNTLGKTGSGATFQNDDWFLLYSRLWTIPSITISGGKGSTAAADWSASKRLTLPDCRGRTLIAAGQGTGLTNRSVGEVLGAQTHTLLINEIPAHSHQPANSYYFGATNPATGSFNLSYTSGNAHQGLFNSSQGNGQAHNNMQPSLGAAFFVATGRKS